MYITKAELQLSLGQKSTALLTGLTDEQINSIITEMSSIIDDYIRRVVELPYEDGEEPTIIKRLCMNLVKYEIWSRYAHSDVPGNIKDDKDWTYKTLEKIQQEKIQLGTETDYTDDEADLAGVGGLADNLKWNSKAKVFNSNL